MVEVFKLVLRKILFQSHWLLSHTTIVKAMDSCDRGINPVTMTFINPWNRQGQSQLSRSHFF